MTRISLYIKRHTDTGLKYLGVTTKDPYTYLGSGLYWTAHLEKHGNQMMTCVLGEFDDIEECSQVALQFSAEHDVVNSVEWANLKPENAKQGWVAGFPQTLESIEKRVAKNTGKKRTEETKRKISESRIGDKHWLYGVCGEDSHWFGRKHTPESIEKMKAIFHIFLITLYIVCYINQKYKKIKKINILNSTLIYEALKRYTYRL